MGLKSTQFPTVEQFRENHLFQAMLAEIFRHSSPIPFLFRYVKKDLVINGCLIKAGSTIALNTSGVAMDPELFPNPTQFNIYNFIREGQYITNAKDFVFGRGRRMCSGIAQASYENMVLMYIMIMNNIPIEYLGKTIPVARTGVDTAKVIKNPIWGRFSGVKEG